MVCVTRAFTVTLSLGVSEAQGKFAFANFVRGT